MSTLKADNAKTRRAAPKALAGYGAIKPRKKPENFVALRQEFEAQVAQEVIGETQTRRSTA